MVDAKTIVLGAAALAFLIPTRVGEAGQAAGTFAGGLAEGITALGTVRISPEFAPNISPKVVPELGLKLDFPSWLDVGSYFPSLGRRDDPEVAEVVSPGTPEVVAPPVVVPPVVVPPVVVEDDDPY